MINATEMTKGFGKSFDVFLRAKQIQYFIAAFRKHYTDLHKENIVQTIKGGDSKFQNTWRREFNRKNITKNTIQEFSS